jgi:hypothetical protein
MDCGARPRSQLTRESWSKTSAWGGVAGPIEKCIAETRSGVGAEHFLRGGLSGKAAGAFAGGCGRRG